MEPWGSGQAGCSSAGWPSLDYVRWQEVIVSRHSSYQLAASEHMRRRRDDYQSSCPNCVESGCLELVPPLWVGPM